MKWCKQINKQCIYLKIIFGIVLLLFLFDLMLSDRQIVLALDLLVMQAAYTPLRGGLHLPEALLVVVVAQFGIYSPAQPQIALSKPCSLALKKTHKPDQMPPLILSN